MNLHRVDPIGTFPDMLCYISSTGCMLKRSSCRPVRKVNLKHRSPVQVSLPYPPKFRSTCQAFSPTAALVRRALHDIHFCIAVIKILDEPNNYTSEKDVYNRSSYKEDTVWAGKGRPNSLTRLTRSSNHSLKQDVQHKVVLLLQE